MNIIEGLVMKTNVSDVKLPKRSTLESAGYDIFSAVDFVIPSKSFCRLKLPFYFLTDEVKKDFKIRFFVRSSFGIKKKVRLFNGNERVDFLTLNPFNEENVVTMFNDSEQDLYIAKDEHFAQFIVSEKFPKKENLIIENIKKEERKKHNIPSSSIEKIKPNVFNYILNEKIILKPNEQILIPTGYKGKIEQGTWLGMYVNENINEDLFCGNGIPIIDQDYYENESNDGNFFLSLVNKKDKELIIKEGTNICSLYAEKYFVLENEEKPTTIRTGGIGSTTKAN